VALADGLEAGGQDDVEDDELLYRRVTPNHWKPKKDGSGFYLSSQAFADPQRRPSVDRAMLCEFDPAYTQQDSANYVLSLLAGEVRGIDTVVRYANGVPVDHYAVDVEPVPIDDNDAHAEIYAHGEQPPNRGAYNKMLEALVQISSWESGFAPAYAD
jgi:hypothetical protein